MRLGSLVDYRKNSVVSRQIINKKTESVTIFSFDKGQGLSQHTVPFEALIYVLDGQARVFISGRPFTVKSNNMIILPANQPHSLKAIKKFKMLLVMMPAASKNE